MRLRLVVALATVSCALALPAAASGADPLRTTGRQWSARVARSHTFLIPRGTSHFALHWPRARGRTVVVRLSRDGRHFGRARRVLLDELSEERGGSEAFGAVMSARG